MTPWTMSKGTGLESSEFVPRLPDIPCGAVGEGYVQSPSGDFKQSGTTTRLVISATMKVDLLPINQWASRGCQKVLSLV